MVTSPSGSLLAVYQIKRSQTLQNNDMYSHCYETLTSHVRFGGCSKPTILLLRHANRCVVATDCRLSVLGSRLFLELTSLLNSSFIRQLLQCSRFTKYSACISPFCVRIPESKIKITESHTSAPPCRLTPP